MIIYFYLPSFFLDLKQVTG